MERRKFVGNIIVGTAALTLPSFTWGKKEEKITILHTNDTHSRIDPFPANHKKYPNKGGVLGRKKMIDRIRAEEEHVLLLDAGDIFQGTPYFNVHKGEVEMKLMTALGYDAGTMGNHDFDAGIEGFEKMLPFADFPFLCANYNFSNTILEGKTKEFATFQKGKIKVGVFGIGVELDGLVSPELYKETQYLDPIENAQRVASQLRKKESCDLVICLSHLGYKPRLNRMCDVVLAKETTDIDLIIGGHSHTFMDRPETFLNKNGAPVLVNQVGWAGLQLGRVDFFFSKDKKPDLTEAAMSSSNYTVG